MADNNLPPVDMSTFTPSPAPEPSSSLPPVDMSTFATFPKATQIRYSAPGQGVQEYTKGSTDEQQFLKRFPNAKAVGSYERTLQPHETVNTEDPNVRSARETAEAKSSLGKAAAVAPAVAAAPIVGAMGLGAGVTGLAVESAAAGLGAGGGELAGRSMVGSGPTTEDVKSASTTAATTAATTFGLGGAFRVIPKIAKFFSNVPGYDPADLHGAVTDAARAAEPSVTTGGSVRNVLEDASNKVLAKSKDLYAQVDAATGGKWSATEQILRNITEKIRGAATDEEIDKLLADKMRYEWKQAALLDQMVEHGVPQEAVDAAKVTYKKAMALLDVDAAVKASTVPGLESDPTIPGNEVADPKKLLGRITKLWDSGRLKEAFDGDEGAVRMMAETKAAALHKDAIALSNSIAESRRALALKLGILGAEGTAAYGAYRWLDPFAKYGGKLKDGH